MFEGGEIVFFIIEMMTLTMVEMEFFLLCEGEINFEKISSFEGLIGFLVNFVMKVVSHPLHEF